jgi:hypothetical protein
MQTGDWVYYPDEDIEFKVHKLEGEFIFRNDNVAYRNSACELCDTEECPRCEKTVPMGQVRRWHSYGVYAGKFCEECAYNGYRDHCGLDGRQGDPQDLDEDIEPEEYYSMGLDLADYS